MRNLPTIQSTSREIGTTAGTGATVSEVGKSADVESPAGGAAAPYSVLK